MRYGDRRRRTIACFVDGLPYFFSPLVHLFVEGGDVSRTFDTQLSPPSFLTFPLPFWSLLGAVSLVLSSTPYCTDTIIFICLAGFGPPSSGRVEH